MQKFQTFAEVIDHIDSNYNFTPRPFKNGNLFNKPEENQGSQKIFCYAKLTGLSKTETLALFCEHYEDVLTHPDGESHQNIRQFMRHGLAGIEFTDGMPLMKNSNSKPSVKINENISKMPANYLFAEIGKRVKAFEDANPGAEIIGLGIGDVTQPLPESAVRAIQNAAEESFKKIKGYGDNEGEGYLLKAIAADYAAGGVKIDPSEIFVNDGAKADTANIIGIFGHDNKIAVGDPVYPVYVDSHAMAGHLGDYDTKTGKWSNLTYMPMTKENNFVPDLPKDRVDIIYLCSPNNPTGKALTHVEITDFVDYAIENNSVIMYDGAYEAYITDTDVPHSIYEIEGAEKVAIEFRSFSKNAGFTGARSGYTVIPHALQANGVELNKLWRRRQASHYNGASRLIQPGAAAMLSPKGKEEIARILAYYKTTADITRRGLIDAGFEVYGGVNSPYIWMKVPHGMTSWQFFDYLLEKAHVVGTPGSGFGPSGEGYFRLTSFGSHENAAKAVERIKQAVRG